MPTSTYLYFLLSPCLSTSFCQDMFPFLPLPLLPRVRTPLHSLLFHLCPDDMCSHATDILYSILCTHTILALYGWPAVLCTYFCLYIVRVQVQYIQYTVMCVFSPSPKSYLIKTLTTQPTLPEPFAKEIFLTMFFLLSSSSKVQCM